MPSINLLKGKNLSREIEVEDTSSASFEEFDAKEKEEVVTVEEESSTPPVSEPEPQRKKSQKEKRPYQARHSRNSAWPLVAGIVGALIIIFVFIYLYSSYKSENEITSSPNEAATDTVKTKSTDQPTTGTEPEKQRAGQPSEQTRVSPQTQPRTTPPVTSVSGNLSQVRRQGIIGASLLNEFLSALPPEIKISFFRFADDAYIVEVASRSQTAFNQMIKNIQAKNSALTPQSSFEKEEILAGQVYTIHQLGGTYSGRGISAPGGANTMNSSHIRADLTSIARQFQLQIKEINIVPASSTNGSEVVPATLKVFAAYDQITEFIRDLINNYQNVGINKMMVSRVSPSELNSSKITAIFDFDIYVQ